MAEKTAEHLSALIDGECPTAEIDLALRRLAKETELQSRWERYHLISDALKNNLPEKMNSDFCQRIRASINDDALPSTPATTPRLGWYKPVAGVAIAASVAAAITLSLDFATTNPSSESEKVVTAPEPSAPQPQLASGETETMPKETIPKELASKFNRYLTSHNEKASMTSVHGILPYVTMVSSQGGR